MKPIIIHISHHNNRLFQVQLNRVASVQPEICPTLFVVYDFVSAAYKLVNKTSKNIDEIFKFEGTKNLVELAKWINDELPQTQEKLIILEANIENPGYIELTESFYLLAENLTNHHIIPFTSTDTCAESANIWYQNANAAKPNFDLEIEANKQISCTQNYLLNRQKRIAEQQENTSISPPEPEFQSGYSDISTTQIDIGPSSGDFTDLISETETNDSTDVYASFNSRALVSESDDPDYNDTFANPYNLPIETEMQSGGWCAFFCCGGRTNTVHPESNDDEIQLATTNGMHRH